MGARTHWLLNDAKLPTGSTEPTTSFFPDPKNVPLKGYTLDDVFSDLERDAQGRATVSVRGRQQRIDILLGSELQGRRALVDSPEHQSWRWAGRGGPAPLSGARAASVPLSAKPETVPPDRGYIAIEPMAGITNSMNLAQKGIYKEFRA